MRISNIQVDGHDLDLLITSVKFAISNLHDINEAIEGDIEESELEKVLAVLEAKK